MDASTMLLIVDFGLFAAAAVGYVAATLLRPIQVVDVKQAFEVLDRSVEKYAPGVPPGSTWKETFERLKESGVKADWGQMRVKLEEYEAYRYGGRDAPREGKEQVMQLAMRLRGSVVGKRAQGKGTGSG